MQVVRRLVQHLACRVRRRRRHEVGGGALFVVIIHLDVFDGVEREEVIIISCVTHERVQDFFDERHH